MTDHDFSTGLLRATYIKENFQDSKTWDQPLPNLEWINQTKFVKHGFFMYSDWVMFTRGFGGPNKNDNRKQLPEGWTEDPNTKVYAKAFIISDMCGYVLLPSQRYKKSDSKEDPYYGWQGKLFIAQFRVCVHDMERKTVGRCVNHYTCRKCKYEHTVDSSG